MIVSNQGFSRYLKWWESLSTLAMEYNAEAITWNSSNPSKRSLPLSANSRKAWPAIPKLPTTSSSLNSLINILAICHIVNQGMQSNKKKFLRILALLLSNATNKFFSHRAQFTPKTMLLFKTMSQFSLKIFIFTWAQVLKCGNKQWEASLILHITYDAYINIKPFYI